MKPLACCAVTMAIGLAFRAAMFAQSTPHLPSPQPRFGENIEVKLIEVDVIVTDRDGNRVYGLKPDDFELFEGRTPQQITNFSEYRSAAGVSPESPKAASPAAARMSHTLLILIDSLPRGVVRKRVFDNLDALLAKVMHEGDRVEIVYWTPGYERPVSIMGSSDPEAVGRAIRKVGDIVSTDPDKALAEVAQIEDDFLKETAKAASARAAQEGSTLLDIDTRMSAEATFAERVSNEMVLNAVKRKAASMRRLVDTLAGRPGKKTILYVSNTFAMPRENTARLAAVSAVDDLARAANAGGVTFYAVRPFMPEGADLTELNTSRDQFDRSLDALRYLTIPTGGLIEIGETSIATLGAKLADDLETYYSIAYRARNDGRDHERKLAVKMRNPEYHARMRESFVEKSNDTVARETLRARLFTGYGGSDIRFEVQKGMTQPRGRDQWVLPIVLKIPIDQLKFAPEGRDQVARLKILITAANGVAESTPVTEDDLRVTRKSGEFVTYSVRLLGDRRGSIVSIGVYDRLSGLVGVQTIDNRGGVH